MLREDALRVHKDLHKYNVYQRFEHAKKLS